MISQASLLGRIVARSVLNGTIKSTFAAAPAKAAAQAVGKKRFRMLPVESDLNKLMTNCCGANYLKDGEEVTLKDDSEYPEWLWKLPLVPPRLHEYDPNTKEYWQKAEVVGQQREWKLRSITNVSCLFVLYPLHFLIFVSQRKTMVVSRRILKDMEYKHRLRFRALAKYHYNAGSEVIEHTERQDEWNMHKKEKYRLPQDSKPFYPSIDQVELPYRVSKNLYFRKNVVKLGNFGK